jgi:hypothetical protein
MRAALLVLGAAAVAAVALLANVALLTHATPSRDPVGRLSPSTTLVHPTTHSPAAGVIGELPDD